MDTMSKDHERIWLQPVCCADPYDGRQWCQDDGVWEDCEDGVSSTEYVRADLAQAERDAAYEQGAKDMRERADGLETVLKTARDRLEQIADQSFNKAFSARNFEIVRECDKAITNTAGRTEG